MATAQLSLWNYAFLMARSNALERLTRHKFEPFSPSLLTNVAHWGVLMKVKVQEPRTTPLPRKARGFCLAGTADSEFENGLRARMPPVPLISIFTPPHFFLARSTAATTPRFPEGNFGRNQLLNDSIGLSPLYSGMTNDLHVSTAAALHRDFSWLRPTQA